MTPTEFHEEVAQPNMEHSLHHPDDVRALVNAVLTLDALAGLIHAHGRAAGVPAMAKHEADDRYRDDLAAVSRSYRVLRDLAASLKHGALDPKRAKARLVRNGGAVQSVANGLGLFQCGDSIGGEVLVVELDDGPGYVRASTLVADSYRMLKRIVDGGPADLDEGDHFTRAGEP
ncbi:hypothetical protein [Lichenibacterium dinghuense]|uniref:hypothetical protein n=1 Tax=Lichenibacterium dinghuense TaxID=2895977 RepID=UPI001F377A3D|nr:hypothetical protein [Lichenibacterium sp. 6Y81]